MITLCHLNDEDTLTKTDLSASNSKKRKLESNDERNFVCRYLLSNDFNVLIPVSSHGLWTRGHHLSEYKQIYSTRETMDIESESQSSDPYSKAIKQLHVAVQPTELPCRKEEQDKVTKYLRSAIFNCNYSRPMYISGMPGTGGQGLSLCYLSGGKFLM